MNKILITFFTILFCLTSSVGWSLEYKDLVKRDGVYYKKFSDVPFTGKVTGQEQGSIKNGKKDGSWIEYWDNGQLKLKGNWKNVMSEGSWVSYKRNGTVSKELTGTYKNGKKISD
ncbi:toxin-antitoxin system YwqK family antitoxin [Alphaproteobacteria bacterium]|nr:toxin-antitoxin system YwqK family antitoxin [Alphaproteobacteria bacterium]